MAHQYQGRHILPCKIKRIFIKIQFTITTSKNTYVLAITFKFFVLVGVGEREKPETRWKLPFLVKIRFNWTLVRKV